MNYIKDLQHQVATKEAALEVIREHLNELRAYMESQKFRCGDSLDGYVNIADIATWATETRQALLDAEFSGR